MKTFPGTGTFFSIIIVLSQCPLNFAVCNLEFPLPRRYNVFNYYGYQSRLEEECPVNTSCPAFDISTWSGDNDQEFVDACKNDEGKVIEDDFTWTCHQPMDISNDSWTMTTLNWKSCVGVSCTSLDKAGHVESIKFGDNVTCDGSNASKFGNSLAFLTCTWMVAIILFDTIGV